MISLIPSYTLISRVLGINNRQMYTYFTTIMYGESLDNLDIKGGEGTLLGTLERLVGSVKDV